MLIQLFPKAFKKFLSLPVLGAVADEFEVWLQDRGYTRSTRRLMFRILVRIDGHLSALGIRELRELTASDLDSCYQALHRCLPKEAGTVRVLEHFLKTRRLMALGTDHMPTRMETLLQIFVDHLQQVCGFERSTINSHRRTAAELLAFLHYETQPSCLTTLSLDAIESFIKATSRRVSRATLQHVVAALRSFLRFLTLHNLTRPGLGSQIESPHGYRLEQLPRSLPWQTVRAFLESIDQSTAMGLRDYTMFLLMATYGLRASEIVELTLEDIDWRRRVLRIRQRKTANILQLPLTDTAGTILFRYLKKGRSPSSYRQVFLRVRAPAGVLKPTAVIEAFQRWTRLSGLPIPFQGAHCLRHSYAVYLLQRGTPLKMIGDLLGHRTVEATGAYLRLSTEDLREVALPVPRTVEKEGRR